MEGPCVGEAGAFSIWQRKRLDDRKHGKKCATVFVDCNKILLLLEDAFIPRSSPLS